MSLEVQNKGISGPTKMAYVLKNLQNRRFTYFRILFQQPAHLTVCQMVGLHTADHQDKQEVILITYMVHMLTLNVQMDSKD